MDEADKGEARRRRVRAVHHVDQPLLEQQSERVLDPRRGLVALPVPNVAPSGHVAPPHQEPYSGWRSGLVRFAPAPGVHDSGDGEALLQLGEDVPALRFVVVDELKLGVSQLSLSGHDKVRPRELLRAQPRAVARATALRVVAAELVGEEPNVGHKGQDALVGSEWLHPINLPHQPVLHRVRLHRALKCRATRRKTRLQAFW
mmetsp:Transcript_29000/g.97812  ORF Transcript_29000/g.97812 Transcript_29000/m.97812 type:complete len:202 (-) Transcript_29000:699-1304(-)